MSSLKFVRKDQIEVLISKMFSNYPATKQSDEHNRTVSLHNGKGVQVHMDSVELRQTTTKKAVMC